MEVENLRAIASNNLRNIPGWSTNRRIIVIESDDWGSIRMPSQRAYERLLKQGVKLHSSTGERYSLYDSIETSQDFEHLFSTLDSIHDINNHNPIITAVGVVANPDFDKIKESGFREYFYEPFTETYKKYKGCEDSFELYKEGIRHKLIIPQFHGREHLNVPVWMQALQSGHADTLLAFNEGMWAIVPKQNLWNGAEYQAAFQASVLSELELHVEIIKEGLTLFEEIFGKKATYFVPPNGAINNSLNKTCYEGGIKFRSASKIQKEPNGGGKVKTRIHWIGQKDRSGVRYITRNCIFEPSPIGKDWVDMCLYDIKTAFRFKKPAVISTHRVNFIGAHDVSNRDHSLRELKRLLEQVVKSWPDVEFMSTDQLGRLMQ